MIGKGRSVKIIGHSGAEAVVEAVTTQFRRGTQ
jgi:hypothetical protein